MRYLIRTDHLAGHDQNDRTIALEARNLLDAIKEASSLCEDEEKLFSIYLYEEVEKDGDSSLVFKRIMRSSTGYFWTVEDRDRHLTQTIADYKRLETK